MIGFPLSSSRTFAQDSSRGQILVQRVAIHLLRSLMSCSVKSSFWGTISTWVRRMSRCSSSDSRFYSNRASSSLFLMGPLMRVRLPSCFSASSRRCCLLGVGRLSWIG